MMEDFGLGDSELEDLKLWAASKREHYERLIRKIDAELTKRTQKELRLGKTSSSAANSSTRDKIVGAMRDSGRWLSNLEIRKLLEKTHGLSLSSNGLRAQLNKGENAVFKRKGIGKHTKWKLIE